MLRMKKEPICRKTDAADRLFKWTFQTDAELFLFFFLSLLQHDVGDDTKNQRAGDFGDRHGAEVQAHAADTGDQDNRHDEHIRMLVQVDVLDHFQTADGDESVQCHEDAAHDAGRNAGDESDQRRQE